MNAVPSSSHADSQYSVVKNTKDSKNDFSIKHSRKGTALRMSDTATAEPEVEDDEPEVFYNITIQQPNGDKVTLKCSNK